MHTFRWMIGVVLTGAAMGSTALTIGSVRSPVWLEQKLDIAVPVQLDSATPSQALCANAEVLFGDSMVDRSQVLVAIENTAAADAVKLRITTSTPVNEPVVTLVLQVGCTQKVTRQYVLLPDIPVLEGSAPQRDSPEVEAAPVPLAPAASVGAGPADAPATGAAQAAPAVAGAPATAPAVVARPKPKPRLRLELQAPVPRRPPAPQPPPPPATERDRLALEPLQALGEQVRKLEETAPAPLEPTVSPEVARMQQLQGDIQLLLKQAAENDAKLAALRERMEKAESDRATMVSVLGVVGVLLVVAAAVALWMYRRQQQAWANQDLDSDPEVNDLIVDFNPVDSDRWEPSAQPVRTAAASTP